MIRLATIGTSSITARLADAVAHTPGIRVAAVHSRDLARAQAFADRIHAGESAPPTPVDDLDGLLTSGRIDAVYIGSPNGVHAAQAREAIAAGVHVLVEKPATTTAAEFESLVAEATDRGVIVLEAMRNVYDPGMALVADLLPRIGPVRLIAFGQCQRSARYDLVLAGKTPAIFDPALGGGALADLGCYPLSALVHLFGAPHSVSGILVPIATGADGAGAATLSYPDAVAQVAFSKITVPAGPDQIQGEAGTITIDEITAPRRIALVGVDGATEEHVVDGAANNMVYEVRRFVDLVTGQDVPAADNARTAAVLRISDALRHGAATAQASQRKDRRDE